MGWRKQAGEVVRRGRPAARAPGGVSEATRRWGRGSDEARTRLQVGVARGEEGEEATTTAGVSDPGRWHRQGRVRGRPDLDLDRGSEGRVGEWGSGEGLGG